MYPYSWPFSAVLTKLNFPQTIRINVLEDKQAKVYTATSPNIKGFVIEAESLEKIKDEVNLMLPEFISTSKNVEGSSLRKTMLHFYIPITI
jgi:hypothetical protein